MVGILTVPVEVEEVGTATICKILLDRLMDRKVLGEYGTNID